MSDTTGEYGPKLAAYIDTRRGATSVREFSAQHNLDPARISTWRGGANPSLDALRTVADGLRVPLGELLLEIGIGTEADFTISAAEPVLDVRDLTPAEQEVLRSLNPRERAMFRNFLTLLIAVREGHESVTVQRATSGRNRTTRP